MVIRDICPRCQSPRFKKNGHMHNGKQNHHCHDCGRQCVQGFEPYEISEDTRALIERLELDWDSTLVWEFGNPMVHHDFQRLPNGNTLAVVFESIPAELTRQVCGGFTSANDPEQMIGDLVQKVTPDGRVVYAWHSWQCLSIEKDVICPLEGRRDGPTPCFAPIATDQTIRLSKVVT